MDWKVQLDFYNTETRFQIKIVKEKFDNNAGIQETCHHYRKWWSQYLNKMMELVLRDNLIYRNKYRNPTSFFKKFLLNTFGI